MFFKKLDKKIETYQRELIDIHHQEVETMYKQRRGWRHDDRNHIQTLKVLVENGNIEELKEKAQVHRACAFLNLILI